MPVPSHAPAGAPTPLSGPGRHVAVVLVFLALTIAFTWPLPVRLTTHVLDTGTDPELLLWALGWNAHAFFTQPLSIFDANIFYPSHYALAYSENMIGSSLLFAPIIWLTGDLVFTMNLVQLSSVCLSAIGAYLLARRLGLSVAAAILAGLVFGFAPARFFRIAQAHLTTIQWMPFCLAYLHTYLGRSGRPRDLRLAVLFYVAQVLASGHGAVFLTVAVFACLAYRVVLGEPIQPIRRLRDLGITGALILLPAVLILLPYRAARAEVPALARELGDYGSSLSSYVSSPTPVHQWLLGRLPAWVTASPPDAYLFIGVLPIVLALIALVTWRPTVASSASRAEKLAAWRTAPVPFYGLLAALAFWFTLGPPIGLWRWTYALPVFSFLRVPSRFVLLEVLAVAILAGFGFQWVSRAMRPAVRGLMAAGLGLLLVVEFMPGSMDLAPFAIAPSSADRWLNGRPKPFVVAEIPIPDSLDVVMQSRRNTLYMLHSTAHWQKIVHGFSGVEPQHYTDLHPKLVRFPDEESLNALVDLGVTYIVFHPDLYPAPGERADAEARFAQYHDWLRVEYIGADSRVYSLHRP